MTDTRPYRVVGTRVRAIDWEAKTDGSAAYATDQLPPGTLVGRILRSPHPHAVIVRLDVSAALAVPGVRAVVTHRDFPPGRRYIHSGPPYSDRFPLADGVVRFVGQEIAAVAADTAEQADRALRSIKVRYRRRKSLLTMQQSRRSRTATLHERATGEANVAVKDDGTFGDVASGRARSKYSVSGTFRYPRVAHACMEPNATVAWWHPEEENLELWTSTQAPWFTQIEVAHVLGLQPDQVICRDVAVGGGFGSKSKICDQEAIAAALSMRAGRPVLIALTREEEFATTKPRHEFDTHLRLHGDNDGRLCLIEADIMCDNGAFNHFGPSVMKVGIKSLGSMYRPDGVEWTARLVDTALTPGGQFRGYGSPQTTFALESLIDELAAHYAIDPLEFRLRNAPSGPHRTLAGQRPESARLAECLTAVRDAINWNEKKSQKQPFRGLGVAASMHGSGSYAFDGSNRSDASIDLDEQGMVTVRFGGSDPGTGQRTVLAQIAAEELGVPLESVRVVMGDSQLTPFDMGAWSSRGTHMGGHAARQAASAMAARLLAAGAAKLGTTDVRLVDGQVCSQSDGIDLGDLVRLDPDATDGVLSHTSTYVDPRMERFDAELRTPNHAASYTFAAHAVEVQVDPATGRIEILSYVAAHDIGRAINPAQVEGQIIGGVVQGLGPVLAEELLYEGGRLVNGAYVHYGLPRAADVPPVEVILIEGPEPAGPYDAKSVGELPIIPPAPAVSNAIYDAIGVRLRDLPFTPDKVLEAMHAGDRRRTYSILTRPDRWQIEAVRRLYPLGLHGLLDRIGTRWARSVDRGAIAGVEAPTRPEEVVAQMHPGSAVIGGGTDVLVQRRQGLISPVRLISTRNVASMRTISETSAGDLRIGAAVTLDQIGKSHSVPDVIREAVDTIASEQIRASATVAGNLLQAKRCWFFRNGFTCYKRGGWTCPCYAVLGDHRFYHAAMGAHRCQATTPSDLATVFTALDASVAVVGVDAVRAIPIERLYSGPGETVLGDREVVEAVVIPAAARRRRGAFEKLRLWEGDFAVVSVALVGAEDEWRVVFGGLAPTPWRARRTERRFPAPVSELAKTLDMELAREAHPLERNAWKVDAAAGMFARVADRVLQ